MEQTVTDGAIETERGSVSYEVCRLHNCEHPECNSRRMYGVKVIKSTDRYLFDTIHLGKKKESKTFCPKHRDSVPESEEAIRREHEEARRVWNRTKKDRCEDQINSMISSNYLPIFRYDSRHGTLYTENERFEAGNFDEYEDAVNYAQNFRVDTPVLLYNDSNRLTIIHPDGTTEEKSTVGNISTQSKDFKQRFSEVTYDEREFYSIRTNSLTGMDRDVPVNELEKHIDKIVEWREYREAQGKINPEYCHVCDGSWGNMIYTRGIRDDQEVIIVSHDRCDSIVGELNLSLLDREAYDLESTQD